MWREEPAVPEKRELKPMAKATSTNGQLPAMSREQAAVLVEYLGQKMLRILTGDADPEESWNKPADLPDQGRSSGDEDGATAAGRGPADGDSAALSVIGLKALAAGRIRKNAKGDYDLTPALSKAVFALIYANPQTMAPLARRK
jgi:hypothetical protein